jgi:hypothetical protein
MDGARRIDDSLSRIRAALIPDSLMVKNKAGFSEIKEPALL